jgi:small subunit ribosomal protein S16
MSNRPEVLCTRGFPILPLTPIIFSANIRGMLKIRLQRTGRKNSPYFRVIVGDKRNAAKSGKFIEVLGSYDPKAGEVTLKEDRVKYWMSKGAQASGTVHNFLVDKKIVEGSKINVLPKKTPIKKEAPAEEPKKESAPAEEASTEAPKEEAPTEEPKEKEEE